MFHTKKLTDREAKWVARAQCPGNLGYQRRHRRYVQAILTHRIIRDLQGASQFGNIGDIVQLHPGNNDVNAQGLFRIAS